MPNIVSSMVSRAVVSEAAGCGSGHRGHLKRRSRTAAFRCLTVRGALLSSFDVCFG